MKEKLYAFWLILNVILFIPTIFSIAGTFDEEGVKNLHVYQFILLILAPFSLVVLSITGFFLFIANVNFKVNWLLYQPFKNKKEDR